MRAKQSSIAQDCERELKAASRGTLGYMASFNSVCEEAEQWQACTNGLFLLPRFGSVSTRWLECRAGPSLRARNFLRTVFVKLDNRQNKINK